MTRSFALPITHGHGGYFSDKAVEDVLWTRVVMRLGIAPEERIMRPDYGAGLVTTTFEPLDLGNLDALGSFVEAALSTIDDLTVKSVSVNQVDEHSLSIRVELLSNVTGEEFSREMTVET